MKYTAKKNLIRVHVFKGHNILVVRRLGCNAKLYINGPFIWTPLRVGWSGRLAYKSEVELKANKEYDDWVEFSKIPNHIPVEQWFNYCYQHWNKYK